MLDVAVNYEGELKICFNRIKPFDEKYKYYSYSSYVDYDNFKVNASEWTKVDRVSVSDDGRILAYFSVDIEQPEFYAKNVSIISFTDYDKIIVMRDLLDFVNMLFIDYKVDKMKWDVIVGSPAEKIYDKFIEKYNGRVVGYFEDDIMLVDRQLYDVKHYELLREDYIESLIHCAVDGC